MADNEQNTQRTDTPTTSQETSPTGTQNEHNVASGSNNNTGAHTTARLHTPNAHGVEQIAGCINMLRNFTGTDPTYRAEHFFQDVDNVAIVGNWSTQTKLVIVKSKFRERAAEFLSDNHELRATVDYEEFQRIIIDRFQAEEPLVTRMHAFMTTTQRTGQDVRQYATLLKSAAAKYFGSAEGQSAEINKLRDQTSMCQFVTGLSDNIKRQVLSRSPQTLAESIEIAIHEEQNLTLMSKRAVVNSIEVSSAGGQQSDLLNQTLQQMLQRMQATERTVGQISQELKGRPTREFESRLNPRRMERDPGEIRPNHRRNGEDDRSRGLFGNEPRSSGNYRSQGTVRDSSQMTCFRCQGIGHMARYCSTQVQRGDARATVPKQLYGNRGQRSTSDREGHSGKFRDGATQKGRNLNE